MRAVSRTRVAIKERSLGTAEAFFEHMTTMHEGMGTANDQIMSGGLFGAIVAR
jgi:hypothetical protein